MLYAAPSLGKQTHEKTSHLIPFSFMSNCLQREDYRDLFKSTEIIRAFDLYALVITSDSQ